MPPPAPLMAQSLDVLIAGGLAEHVDPHVLPPGSWARLENVVYDKAGALQKRPGYDVESDELVDGTALPTINTLAVRQSELAGVTSPSTGLPYLLSYSAAREAWVVKDDACPATVRREPVVRGYASTPAGYVARSGGLLVYTWTVPGEGIFWRVVDESTGAVVRDDAQLAPDGLPHVTYAMGAHVVVVHGVVGSPNMLRVTRIAIPAFTTATLDLLTTTDAFIFDAHPLDSTTLVVAYVDTGAPTALVVSTVHVGFLVTSGSDTATIVAADGIAVTASAAGIAVAYVRRSTTEVFSVRWSAVLAPVYGPTLLDFGFTDLERVTCAFRVTGTLMVGVQAQTVTLDDRAAIVWDVDLAGAAIGSSRLAFSVYLWSRPFRHLGLLYVVAVTHWSTVVLLCLDHTTDATAPLLLCGYVMPGESFPVDITGITTPAPSVVLGNGQDWFVPVLARTSPGPEAFVSTGLDLVTWDFAEQQAALHQGVDAQRCLAQTGAFAGWYDGVACVEQGFLAAPEIRSHTVTGAAGDIEGASPDNLYAYTAVYEWFDAQGNLHQSEPSLPYEVAVSAADDNAEVELSIRCLSLTRRGDADDGVPHDVTIAVYRTLANAPEQSYRITPRAGSGVPVNDRVSETVLFTDSRDDAAVLALEWGQLYTDGGLLPNLAPSPPRALCLHKNRLWGIASDDDRLVLATRLLVRGEAPGWHPGLSVRLDDSPDGATALAGLDDKLVVFTSSRIYYVTGQGPNDQGADGAFDGPYLVTSSVGCIDARSVVTFEGGAIFQSAGGVYLLDRSLQLQWIGAPVDEQLAARPEVLGGFLDAARGRIVWLVRGQSGGEDGPSTRFLVFDYDHKAWLVWRVSGRQYAHALYQGAHRLATNLGVARENFGPSPGFDFGQWCQSFIQTPPIHVAAIGGYQRCKRVQMTGQRLGQHYLVCDIFTDFASASTDTATWDVTATSPLPGLPVLRPQMHVGPQKCSTISIRLSDYFPLDDEREPYGGQAGFRLTGLSLLLGVKEGLAKHKQRST